MRVKGVTLVSHHVVRRGRRQQGKNGTQPNRSDGGASKQPNSNQRSRADRGIDQSQYPHEYSKHPPKKRVPVQGAMKVWGTLRSATPAVVANAIERLSNASFDPKSLRVKRKFKTTQDGSVKKWWFVIRGDVSVIHMLDQEWGNIANQTGWKLEQVYCYEDSIPACTLPAQQPQTSPISDLDNVQQPLTPPSTTVSSIAHSEDSNADGVTPSSQSPDTQPPENTLSPFLGH